jgi:hypothetical protein
MHDSFDGFPPLDNRRSVLGRLVFGIAGLVGLTGTATAKNPSRPPHRSGIQFTPPPALVDLTDDQLHGAWNDLADPQKADAAVQLLGASKQTVSLLSEHLKPAAAPADVERVEQLIEELQSNRFATRQAATAELEKFGPAAEPALRKVLNGHPNLELSRRIEAILEHWHRFRNQFCAGLRALTMQGSPAALELLTALAKGHAASWRTEAAIGACEQLRTANWYMQVYGPLQAQAEARELLNEQMTQQLNQQMQQLIQLQQQMEKPQIRPLLPQIPPQPKQRGVN